MPPPIQMEPPTTANEELHGKDVARAKEHTIPHSSNLLLAGALNNLQELLSNRDRQSGGQQELYPCVTRTRDRLYHS